MFISRLLARLVVAAAAIGCVLLVPAAALAASGAVDVPLTSTAAGCPTGSYVVTNPGVAQTPLFVLVPPGPANCAGGLDVMISPGQSPTGEAVTLPLTASSCQSATGLFNNELTALGQNGGSGPPGSSSACPAGDAALNALQTAIGTLPQLQGGHTDKLLQHATDLIADDNFGRVPSLGGIWWYDATGTPRGGFTEDNPGILPIFYGLTPSGTAGVATVCQPPAC